MTALRPRYEAGGHVPAVASAAIVGGTFVAIDGSGTPLAATTQGGEYIVKTCGAGAWAFGVAVQDVTSAQLAQDSNSVEQRVDVVRAGAIARVVPGATLATPGTAVKSDASGRAVAQGGTGVIVGYTVTACLSSDPFVEVALI